MSANKYDLILKIIVVGSTYGGKTSMINQYCDGVFSDNFITTIGMDFKIKYITVGKYRVKIQFWDTAGQERFKTLTSAYYRGANGAIFIFDLADKKSFRDVANWMDEYDKFKSDTCYSVLVGNKVDLPNRQVTQKEINALAEGQNLKYFETSVKDNIGLDLLFDHFNEELVKILLTNKSYLDTKGIRLTAISATSTAATEEKKNKCCK